MGARHRLDLVLTTPREQVKRGDRRAQVLPRQSKLAREGRAESEVSVLLPAHVRDLVGQERHIRRRQARDGRFARAGGAGEQERAAIAHGARRVDQEAALPGEEQRVQDAQHRIAGVGIGGLPDSSTAQLRVQLGLKITALEKPAARVEAHADAFLLRDPARRDQLDFKKKRRAVRAQPDRHPPYLDRHLARACC
ncbi:MAG: hypothetical protein DMG08_29125 [Acidobacteria bacterium]|nr:MAG: hypothetical protein DMG08_29125 [Acidobacteriota bacterium]